MVEAHRLTFLLLADDLSSVVDRAAMSPQSMSGRSAATAGFMKQWDGPD